MNRQSWSQLLKCHYLTQKLTYLPNVCHQKLQRPTQMRIQPGEEAQQHKASDVPLPLGNSWLAPARKCWSVSWECRGNNSDPSVLAGSWDVQKIFLSSNLIYSWSPMQLGNRKGRKTRLCNKEPWGCRYPASTELVLCIMCNSFRQHSQSK